ncbi:MAG: ABC transporter substrate-binding protein [Clostridiales bacterium]|jgi:iron complex transport system substrate-binding protein|nr:ABC transporter substrate-binding protein [Clostridiales bacterium]
MSRKIIALLILLATTVTFTACGGNGGAEAAPAPSLLETVIYDREGHPITLPDEVNTVISIGPGNTEILTELGFGDQIIATDMFSGDVEGIAPGISVLDMMALDAEFIINANPDIIFITGMTRIHGEDHPLRPVSDAGIAVIYMPVANTIGDIMEDIRFIGAVMGAEEAGEEIALRMQLEIDRIALIAMTAIEEPRRVYFEIAPAPAMWAIGGGTFQHEMIELVGAINIFADYDSWISVSDEMFLEHNPDVILTSTNFIDDPVGEILSRPGWGAITAVQEGNVVWICTDATSRPSHNIIEGLREIARAIYPEYFYNES